MNNQFYAIIPGRMDPNIAEMIYGSVPTELLTDYYICTDPRNTCITLRPKTQLLIKEIK